jgi:hypothetical protein
MHYITKQRVCETGDTPYMKYDATHILTSLKNDVKDTKRTSRDTKNENKRHKQ